MIRINVETRRRLEDEFRRMVELVGPNATVSANAHDVDFTDLSSDYEVQELESGGKRFDVAHLYVGGVSNLTLFSEAKK